MLVVGLVLSLHSDIVYILSIYMSPCISENPWQAEEAQGGAYDQKARLDMAVGLYCHDSNEVLSMLQRIRYGY